MHVIDGVDVDKSSWITRRPAERSDRNTEVRRFAIRAAAYSIQGRRRTINQDCFSLDPGGLFLVADGMGEMQSGQVASNMAIEELSRRLAPASLRGLPECDVIPIINLALIETHHRINAFGNYHPECRGMGTTIVVGLQLASRFYIANVGDSRAYRLRFTLVQQSVNHTIAQSLLDDRVITREQAARHSWPHIIWNALGSQGRCEPNVHMLELRPGDRFLLTTSGITAVVPDVTIRQALCQFKDPSTATRRLVNAAVSSNSVDDATCAAIYIDSHDSCQTKTTKSTWSLKERLLFEA